MSFLDARVMMKTIQISFTDILVYRHFLFCKSKQLQNP